MQAFELHFNPKKVKGDVAFESFCFEPENIVEKSVGNLYAAGQLSNVLPQNSHFLDSLADSIKQEYYRKSQRSPEQGLKDSLRRANEFLSSSAKDGNVNWMGNLDFLVLGIKDFIINFAKVGDITILLFHDGEIMDIGSNLEYQDTQTMDPLKVFGSIASGKVVPGDKVAVLTPKVFDFLNSQNLINDLAMIDEEKSLKAFLSIHKEELSEIYGVCLLLLPGEDIKPKEMIHIRTPRIGQIRLIASSLKAVLSKSSEIIRALITFLKSINPIKKLSLLAVKLPRILPVIRLPMPRITIHNKDVVQKKLILIVQLLIILAIGGLIFRGGSKKTEVIKEDLSGIQSETSQAEGLVILNKNDKANALFQKALTEILALRQKNKTLSENALAAEKKIEDNLNKLNNVATIQNPEFVADAQNSQGILLNSDTLYILNNDSSLTAFNLAEKKANPIENDKQLAFGTIFSGNPLFVSKPNILLFWNNNQWSEETFSYPENQFSDIIGYGKNAYLLDPKSGEIIKYSVTSNSASDWFDSTTKKATNAKSIAIDSNIWILTGDNKIDKYSKGKYIETLALNIFPTLQNPVKILTSYINPYLFILDSGRNRIIAIDKQGKLIKQYQSAVFDNLIDFAVSADGKEIYLLNGNKIYLIKP